jgi:hypothetical protein
MPNSSACRLRLRKVSGIIKAQALSKLLSTIDLSKKPMPQFAANLSLLFTELPFLDRFEAAAKAEFKAVELQFPYAFAVEDIKQRLDAHGL